VGVLEDAQTGGGETLGPLFDAAAMREEYCGRESGLPKTIASRASVPQKEKGGIFGRKDRGKPGKKEKVK